MSKLLFLAGSARKDSCNKKLARTACKLAESLGADATFIDLKDYPMPLFCEDEEAENGMPEHATRLKRLFQEHDGFFIASPEYNSSFSPLLKNVIDWMSRPSAKGETPMIAFKDKIAALGAASPGALGGLRGLVPLRMMLGNIAVHVIPNQIAITQAFQAFDEHGQLTDTAQQKMLKNVVAQLVETAAKHSAGETNTASAV